MTTNQSTTTTKTPATPQYCARVKTQDGYVLTKSLPLGELVDLCKDSLAVDIIYLVEILPDGGLRSNPIGFFSVVFNKLDSNLSENNHGHKDVFNSSKEQTNIQGGSVGENRTTPNTKRKETTGTPRKSGVAKRKNTRGVSRSNSKVGKVVPPTVTNETLNSLKAKFADLPDGEFEISSTDLPTE